MLILNRTKSLIGIALLLSAEAACADGLLGIDHRPHLDDDGIWGRNQQHIILGTMVTAEILVGLWEGGNSRLGRTNWQAIDASLLSAVTSEALKRTFRRVRPSNTDNPALPVYDAIARLKTRGHWPSDVLAGFILGTAAGYYAHQRHSSFTLSVMPHGVQVGYRTRW
jgi:hypothetical protein